MTKEENMEHILDDIIFDNNPVVVGVSSGPDSMCLLNLLEQKTNKLVVCHINHNVRKESTTEEEYLKDYCQKHNLIFESMKITEYKETNFENEARKKRYNFYEEILSKYHSTKLFLAHHGDDQIETILMKIVRGSNLEGYAGIKEISKVKNYQIIRPLLKVTKEDIINYNKSHNITYFIDSSNTNTDYTRNRYRQKILPLLKEEAEGGKQKNLLFGKRLDMRALHRKDGGIFTRTRLPDEEQKLSVGLLVDESGSMGWGDRITHARKTAIVLYDFCMSLGIPITIYGHSLYSYAEFDSLDASDRYRLMDMSARNGNRDGAALRYVAEHLAKRPESQKLLIIISDGQPADCGYSGTEAEADLRGIKNEYRKRGIVIFAAAIGDDKENIRRIYQDVFLDITKLEDLPKNMTQLVKQYLK